LFRIITMPFIYTFLLLLLKLLFVRIAFFQQIEWSSLPSDALSLLVLLCIVELATPVKWKTSTFWAVNLILSLLLFASALYAAHFGSVPTYTALLALKQVIQIRASIGSTAQLSHYIYFVDLIVLLILSGLVRSRGQGMVRSDNIWRTGVILVALTCVLLSARTIQLDGSIANESVRAEKLGFINYQVAAAIRINREASAAAHENLEDISRQIRQLKATYPYQASSQQGATPLYYGAAKGKNLIVVQLEAFQSFPIHLSLAGQELTPVLNELAGNGFYFPHVFQQIGQGNTSDAEFIANTSIYPTGTIAMSMGFGDRELPSLPRLLKQEGYVAATFHVNEVKFWERNKLYPALGFDHYYDKPFYENDHFNDFGPSDEQLYKVGMDKIRDIAKQNKPFYTQFVTVSSHFPFKVPEDRQRITLPEALQNTQLGDYLSAIEYTDYALGTFIDRLKQEGLWDDTVMVVYGDHFGLQPQANEPSWIQSQLGIPYDSYVSRFNIPLIIHLPGERIGKVVDQVGGQLDIMPTVANLLGMSLEDMGLEAFGNDLLNIDHNVIGMRYYLPTGSFLNDEILFTPGQGFEDGTARSIKTLEPVSDITPYREDYDYILKLMGLSDAYVRLLPKRGF
jgi:lipoteichoic acid synthase